MRSKCETSSGAINLPQHVHQNAIEDAWKNHMFSLESQLVGLQSFYDALENSSIFQMEFLFQVRDLPKISN